MDIQEILVLVLFLLAAAYIGRLIYRTLHAKSGCASGCGKCAADFSKVKLKD